jgi:enoyl-CoA hydratase
LRALRVIDTDLLTREKKAMAQATEAQVFETLLYEKKGDLAYVTVNRPKVLNALNRATFTEIGAAFADAGADPAVKGVIVTGAGDKAFIAARTSMNSRAPRQSKRSRRPVTAKTR